MNNHVFVLVSLNVLLFIHMGKVLVFKWHVQHVLAQIHSFLLALFVQRSVEVVAFLAILIESSPIRIGHVPE